MIYVTTRRFKKKKKINWLDLISEPEPPVNELASDGSAATITRRYEEVPAELLDKIDVPKMISILKDYNQRHQNLHDRDKRSMYKHYNIPKKSGTGLRPIDEPCDELQDALLELKNILADKFGVLHHTSGFAYVTDRCTLDAVKKHQAGECNWFYHTDASGFFPSTTLKFTMKMVKMIFPLSEICKSDEGYNELKKALSLGFLNGGLPQGTKLSPYLTNVIMIPIDFKLFNDLAHRRFIYTRYADDMHISCKQYFKEERMTDFIQNVFRQFDAPWQLKPEKTHYGSRKGKNYILGVCLNADNNITVGWRNKKLFKAKTTNLIMDFRNGKTWSREDLMEYAGLLSYYKMVEKEYFEKNIIQHFNNKFKVDLEWLVKRLLSRK